MHHKYNSYFVNNFKINSINTNLTFAAKTQNIKKPQHVSH